MSNTLAAERPAARASIGAYLWFFGMTSMWTAFFALTIASPDTLADLETWIRELPILLELLVWFLAFPGALAVAVWESSGADWLRLLLVACFAVGWTVASIPRRPRPRASATENEAARG